MASGDSRAMPYAFLLIDVLVGRVYDLGAARVAGTLGAARSGVALAAAGRRGGRGLGPLVDLHADLLGLRVQRVDRPPQGLRVVRHECLPEVLDSLLDGLLRPLGDLVSHLAEHLLPGI